LDILGFPHSNPKSRGVLPPSMYRHYRSSFELSIRCIERIAPVIARAMSQIEAAKIVQQLLDTTTIRTTATDLAIAARKDAPTITLPLEYQRHARIFSDEEAQRFPPSRPWDHAINLKPDTPDTINCKVYPLAPARKLALRKWIDEEEAKGYIRKSQSPITSSWFEIAKKTGDPRPVQDYRIINKYTIKVLRLGRDVHPTWVMSTSV
jgi:hypothetical protein